MIAMVTYSRRPSIGTGTEPATRPGREDLRWHDLRHSGAVLAAATGASLAELMARLGHSTPQAALRYQHVAQGRDKQIAALLSKLGQRLTVGHTGIPGIMWRLVERGIY